ncbi:MAG: glutamate 5-kinase [Deltaproteobacteria bacterium]|nr:glutamate 5-kinase [Deltaproteobacteria bacterium]
MKRSDIPEVRRAVIKLGSRVLVSGDRIDAARLGRLVDEIAALRKRGLEVAVVTSGAVASGRSRLGLKEKPKTIPLKQATAAVGQSLLMHSYGQEFGRHGLVTGQVLITQQVVSNRQLYLNARNTLETLFELGVVPVINENDTVSVEEIKFGDNDRLSAIVAGLLQAQLLVILTDVDGLYDQNPNEHPDARRIGEVSQITDSLKGLAGGTSSEVGLGGMKTKLDAAETGTRGGAAVVIASGIREGVLSRVFAGEDEGTFFAPDEKGMSRRRHWIAHTLQPKGELVLDAGATQALRGGKKSLLPAGVREVRGEFDPGDCVKCLAPDGREFARGIVAYGSRDAARIAGRKTEEIEKLLGYRDVDELIHRDDLVILNG